MKIHFYISLLLLAGAAVCGLYCFNDQEALMGAVTIQFWLGIQQIVASIMALIISRGKAEYFKWHLVFVLVAGALFCLVMHDLEEDIRYLILFGLPWIIAIHHTYQVYHFKSPLKRGMI